MLDVTSYMLGKKAGGGAGVKYVVVEELPQTGDEGTIYLVPKTTTKTKNIYDEYMYINENWELIGDTQADLSNYVDMTSAQTISGKKTFTTLPESSITPSSDNQLSNKKYVDDNISGKQNTIDSSHKLDADLVDDTNSTHKFFSGNSNDLIHYKGHVNSTDDLPSTGQESASAETPLAVVNSTTMSTILTPTQRALNKYTNFKSTYNYAFGFIDREDRTGYVDTIVCTNYPETIKGIYMDMIDKNNGDPYNILVRIEATQDKPVYAKKDGFHSNNCYLVADNDDNTRDISGNSSFLTITKSCWVWLLVDTKYANLIGNLPTPLKIISYKSQREFYKYSSGSATTGSLNYYPLMKTWQINNYNYTYNYRMFKFNPQTYSAALVTNETDVQENDTYTVGDTNEIYRANSVPSWEIWSKQLDLTTITGYDATKTQVLKNVNGTIQWVDET